MYQRVIIVCGMPRSGTSWLGQIFDSSPDVAYRLEPLFSYRFKNIINHKSNNEDIRSFFEKVYLTDDHFIRQDKSREKKIYCSFQKNHKQKLLVIKTTRHHNLLENYLKIVDNIEIVSIVRHPCAVISSWIKTEREFESKGCTIKNDWKSGKCRKIASGEYWGFDDWILVTKLYLKLNQKFENFNIIKYSDLVNNSSIETKNLFSRLSIPYGKQTEDFLKRCHSRHDNDPYSVFKDRNVEHRWKDELEANISEEIIRLTKKENLESFLV